MKDRYGVMAHESLKKISNVFGAQVEDIKAIEAPVLSLSDCEVKGWFLSLELFPSTAEIIGVFDNGKCAVTKNSYYDGTAYRIGTMFFQRYFTRQSQASRKLLCEMLNIQKEIGLLNPTHLLRLKVLEGDGKRLLILKTATERSTHWSKFRKNITSAVSIRNVHALETAISAIYKLIHRTCLSLKRHFKIIKNPAF